ncbi:hypothetical protein [Desulfogranum mediterraneum]|uniref:hypothetical protein n=1 Tax=Desulfogranum mediterraneum TaxID=160661 RepID=UPI000425A50B|nr:hypothetical protein [Desulfogranum mediterraneum]
MSRVSLSDYLIALCDLAEVEGKALQEGFRSFLAAERQGVEELLYRSSRIIARRWAALLCLLVALGYLSWGAYLVCASYISPLAAPFIIGSLWLLFGLLFVLAARVDANE